ncbi:transcription initiation factor TFIID subunit 6 [Leptinotarsa decemlineata]|uniref:transcription initiation factor TFIID subunit 6 n=1 Tax=Leptinotarsa decemlineata TaxID=7539 RepID=UPI003D30D618
MIDESKVKNDEIYSRMKISNESTDIMENNHEMSIEKSMNDLFEKFSPKPDTIFLKLFPDEHPLSAEQQIFFINITEGIFGYNEQVRNENLKILTSDYNIKYLLPYLCTFIKETIQVNIAFPDLTLLIYSVRMVKCLLSNPHLNMVENLHNLIPAVLSCALARKISKYYYDNHWTLRDFSVYIIATICKKYNTELNNITGRIIRIYLRPLREYSSPLTTMYGAIKGLGCLGDETVKTYLFPNTTNVSKRMHMIFERKMHCYHPEERSKQQNLEAKHVRDVILNTLAPALYKSKNVNDGGLLYSKYFGYLGKFLYMDVKNLEKIETDKQKALVYDLNYFVPSQSFNQNSS